MNKIKERSILFMAPMVQAILAGQKGQTRRDKNIPCELFFNSIPHRPEYAWRDAHGNEYKCPYGEVGDRLWVKETFSDAYNEGASCICYKADYERIYIDEDKLDKFPEKYTFSNWAPDLESGQEGRWRPSIFMPRIVSRILLEIVNIKVEQLNSISEADAMAEGFHGPMTETDWLGINQVGKLPSKCFSELWEKLNGAGSWSKNPWVWVIEFKVLEIKK